jgi:hypothetical protein
MMPCVVQPGGGGEKICVRYTGRRKHGILAAAKRLMAEGMTLWKAAAELHVSHSYLSPEFCAKSFTARCSAVKRFMVTQSFAYQMGTHTLQRVPAEVESKALDFMVFMHHIVFGGNCDRHFVINMDQMPVYFSMNAKRTLELTEEKNQSTFALQWASQSGWPWRWQSVLMVRYSRRCSCLTA